MFFFIKYLWISIKLPVSKVLQSIEKSFTHPFNPAFFFMLLAEKSSEIFPKHKGCFCQYAHMNSYLLQK